MEEGAVAMQTNMAEQVVPVAMDKEEPNMPEMKELILPETEELITPEMMQQIMSDVKWGQGLIEEERGSFSLKDTTFQAGASVLSDVFRSKIKKDSLA